MTSRALILLVCVALGAPAWGASGLELARTRAQAARAEVRNLRGQQQSLRDELNGLAARIETLKAEHQGRLTTGPELETALRRSQELSGTLTGLAQAVSGAEGEAERSNLALHAALSEELERLRTSWEGTTDRAKRAQLLESMRTVRTERDAVRAALPASKLPTVERTAPGGDDPEDLLEQADALRDTGDKVRDRLKALRGRIREVREERDLDRRMNDFLGEESMFDDQDRRLRVRLGTGGALTVDGTPKGGRHPSFDQATDSPGVGVGDDPNQTPDVGGPGGVEGGGGNPGPSISVRASDRRPQVDSVRAQDLAAGGPVDLKAMETEATRLESLAGELDGRASALEHRARELEGR